MIIRGLIIVLTPGKLAVTKLSEFTVQDVELITSLILVSVPYPEGKDLVLLLRCVARKYFCCPYDYL